MSPTPAQRELLDRAADGTVYVYSDPARVGGGVRLATLGAVRRAGWVVLGDYVPLRGRPLVLTDAGRAVREETDG